jgi:hypothetical protein
VSLFLRGGGLVTPTENVVFGHYLTKYRLMKLGFSWSDIDLLHPREMDIMLTLYSAIIKKEQGYG